MGWPRCVLVGVGSSVLGRDCAGPRRSRVDLARIGGIYGVGRNVDGARGERENGLEGVPGVFSYSNGIGWKTNN